MSFQPSDPLANPLLIRCARILRGLRLRDVAAASGLSVGYLSMLE